jgi:hypothetical protein
MSESTVLPLRTAVRHTSRHDAALDARRERGSARSSPGQDGFTISKSHAVPRNGRSERSLQRDDFPHLIVTDAQLTARWKI